MIKNGKLIPKCTEKLEDCLMEDCFADLNSINKQGLLTRKSQSQSYIEGSNVYFYYPRDNSVSRVFALSDRAFLSCNWSPSTRDPVLGVRAVMLAKN